MAAQIVLAACFAGLAVGHSALGEAGILRPLFAAEWTTAETPRWAMEAILRFAWHLTSITWLAIAVIALDVEPYLVLGLLALVSAAIIFFRLRGHLAWPIFLLGGLAGLWASEPLPTTVLQIGAGLTVVGLGAAAALHVYWAAGGRWFFDRAAPPSDWGVQPGPLLTLAVAIGLGALAAAVAVAAFGELGVVRWIVVAGLAAFTLRAVGDGKAVGFSKQDRSTAFAQDDDRFFSPIVVFLALGMLGALLV